MAWIEKDQPIAQSIALSISSSLLAESEAGKRLYERACVLSGGTVIDKSLDLRKFRVRALAGEFTSIQEFATEVLEVLGKCRKTHDVGSDVGLIVVGV